MNKLSNIEKQRQDQLEKNIPEIWTYKSVLYIGACAKRFHFNNALKNNGMLVDLLEIDPERAEEVGNLHRWLNHVYCKDVRRVDEIITDPYDVVFWSHGPEMVPKHDIPLTLNKLWDLTGKVMVLMCPWGKYSYSAKYKSKYKNITSLYEEDFEGFNISTLGDVDTNGNNLLAWRYK